MKLRNEPCFQGLRLTLSKRAWEVRLPTNEGNRTCLCGDTTTMVSVQSIIQRTHTTYVWRGHKSCMQLILTSHSLLACDTIQYVLLDRYQQYHNKGGHILEHNVFIHTTVKTSNFRSQLKLKTVYCQTVLQCGFRSSGMSCL